ncbi:UDP-glucose 4-epimerase GalE [Pleionea sp. CnH1-48]|uniref:UDP-glucose 4-epimerase GalE n=1 Tax=Pleionea sp. CnH1-48 TaxID=2954494 RepID=UPI002096918A|nr:UDP-glucose 4-epimerase GalE [Pleionea sp. CnH1-48]MCO7223813.1 UDP-glucose 4-epimerase GalE [Pleionea sp. CnH1-48]
METILVTGGTGYIGSHTVVQLLESNYNVVIVDNLSNSSKAVLQRVEQITGKMPTFYQADIRDEQALTDIFNKHKVSAVIHFAGLKAVGESSQIPLEYYEQNIYGTLVLCQVMAKSGCKRIVFSSSATVYGDPASVPITEQFPTSATNPYGRTKLFIEHMLSDLHQSDPEWHIVLLRYFNPIGAHPSGLIGEDPKGIPNNLLPFVTQVAVGKRTHLSIFGNDYSTKDGTGVRDYIHVVDLANAHLKATEKLERLTGLRKYNLGTGQGYSVLEIVMTFERVTDEKVPYEVTERRPGDIAECWADASLAKAELNWSAQLQLDDMLVDAWRWQSGNPDGYAS